MDEKRAKQPENQLSDQFIKTMWGNEKKIFAYIISLVPNQNDAEDIMQEAMSRMWQKFSEFEPGSDFVAWGKKIAWYCILEARKKKQRSKVHFRSDVLELLEDASQSVFGQMDARKAALEECVESLPSKEKKMVWLHYGEDIKGKDLSQRIGLSLHQTYRALVRIHAILLACVRRRLMTE